MRPPRLPPLDTSEYISCPIDTPLFDFDQKSPLPCIIVTPSSPTEYHIAFHHKSSPLKHASFIMQQGQQEQQWPQQPRPRRGFLVALNPFAEILPVNVPSFDLPIRRFPLFRNRTTLILAIPIFIIVCHFLVSLLLRSVGFGSNTLFGGSITQGGFSSAAARMRAHKEAQPRLFTDSVPVPVQHDPLDQTSDPQPLVELTLD